MAKYIELERALALIKPDAPEDEKAAITIATAKKFLRNLLYSTPVADVAPVGWISVKDKLPEPEQDVLIIAHGWSGRLLYIGSYHRMEAETSWLTGVTSKASDWLLWGWSYLREPEVTHWMPLPELPMSARMDGYTNKEEGRGEQ